MTGIVSVEIQSGYDNYVYRIDTIHEDYAAKWLLDMALKFGPSQGGTHYPMKIIRCEKWDKK